MGWSVEMDFSFPFGGLISITGLSFLLRKGRLPLNLLFADFFFLRYKAITISFLRYCWELRIFEFVSFVFIASLPFHIFAGDVTGIRPFFRIIFTVVWNNHLNYRL